METIETNNISCFYDDDNNSDQQNSIPMNQIIIMILGSIIVTKLLVVIIREKAFEELGDNKNNNKRFGFVGASPGFGYRGIHQLLVHTPMFIVQLIPFIFVQVPIYLMKLYIYWLNNENGRYEREPTDDEIYDYVVNTPLFLLAQIIEDNTTGKEIIFIDIPNGTNIEHQCNGNIGAVVAGSSLQLKLDPQNKKILSATILKDNHYENDNNNSNDNDDENNENRINLESITNKKQTRNDILMSALHLIVTVWIHPCTHRLAEMNAIEIRENNIELLEPSSRFVESLHEGLLLGPLSPASDNDSHPLHTGIYSSHIRTVVSSYPIPPHFVNDQRKLKYSKSYDFLIKMRGILSKLVKKYNIHVNVEYLFHNIVVHAIDHYMVYKTLHNMNLRISMDGSCTYKSYIDMFIYKDYWLVPKHNIIDEERTKYIDLPFYNDLYFEANNINQELADQMVTSCSF